MASSRGSRIAFPCIKNARVQQLKRSARSRRVFITSQTVIVISQDFSLTANHNSETKLRLYIKYREIQRNLHLIVHLTFCSQPVFQFITIYDS